MNQRVMLAEPNGHECRPASPEGEGLKKYRGLSNVRHAGSSPAEIP